MPLFSKPKIWVNLSKSVSVSPEYLCVCFACGTFLTALWARFSRLFYLGKNRWASFPEPWQVRKHEEELRFEPTAPCPESQWFTAHREHPPTRSSSLLPLPETSSRRRRLFAPPPRREPTGDVPGALIHQLVLHQCLISTLRPLRNFPLLLEGFLLVYFLTILLDTLPLPFSSDNE